MRLYLTGQIITQGMNQLKTNKILYIKSAIVLAQQARMMFDTCLESVLDCNFDKLCMQLKQSQE